MTSCSPTVSNGMSASSFIVCNTVPTPEPGWLYKSRVFSLVDSSDLTLIPARRTGIPAASATGRFTVMRFDRRFRSAFC
eukprot:7350949-Prymnesium_polylepis.1